MIGETHEKRRVNRKIGKSFTCSMFKKKKTIKRLGISKLREHNQSLPRLGDIPKKVYQVSPIMYYTLLALNFRIYLKIL